MNEPIKNNYVAEFKAVAMACLHSPQYLDARNFIHDYSLVGGEQMAHEDIILTHQEWQDLFDLGAAQPGISALHLLHKHEKMLQNDADFTQLHPDVREAWNVLKSLNEATSGVDEKLPRQNNALAVGYGVFVIARGLNGQLVQMLSSGLGEDMQREACDMVGHKLISFSDGLREEKSFTFFPPKLLEAYVEGVQAFLRVIPESQKELQDDVRHALAALQLVVDDQLRPAPVAPVAIRPAIKGRYKL